MSSIAVTAGIDCGESRLDVALFGAEDKLHFVNTADGHRELLARLTSHGVSHVGMEAEREQCKARCVRLWARWRGSRMFGRSRQNTVKSSENGSIIDVDCRK
ncbi:hypothetical protein VH569_27775 [Azospirillum sp. 11R-A]|uniref:hypothetical protein n=1 Tax=Azospirillum sp. 11R-A TaxID=3111634 RepID=UPI003C19EAE8